MGDWTFDAGGIRFGDGGPGLGGFLSGSAQAVVGMHNAQVAGLQQQLVERDAALAQEHVVAGEAMVWVEFLYEALAALVLTSGTTAVDMRVWDKAMKGARAALAECDPGKAGPARPRPLKEAEAAMAGMRQVLDRLDATSCKYWCRKGWLCEPGKCPIYDAFEPVNAARHSGFGRDRLALEQEMADIVTKAANIPLEQLAAVGIVDLMETVHRLKGAGLP